MKDVRIIILDENEEIPDRGPVHDAIRAADLVVRKHNSEAMPFLMVKNAPKPSALACAMMSQYVKTGESPFSKRSSSMSTEDANKINIIQKQGYLVVVEDPYADTFSERYTVYQKAGARNLKLVTLDESGKPSGLQG